MNESLFGKTLLLLQRPKIFINARIVNWISIGVMPTAILGREREEIIGLPLDFYFGYLLHNLWDTSSHRRIYFLGIVMNVSGNSHYGKNLRGV